MPDLNKYNWGVPVTQEQLDELLKNLLDMQKEIVGVFDQGEKHVCIALQILITLKVGRKKSQLHGNAMMVIKTNKSLLTKAISMIYFDLLNDDLQRNNFITTLKEIDAYFKNEDFFLAAVNDFEDQQALFSDIHFNLKNTLPVDYQFNSISGLLNLYVDRKKYSLYIEYDKVQIAQPGNHVIRIPQGDSESLSKFITLRAMAFLLSMLYKDAYQDLLKISFNDFNEPPANGKNYKNAYMLILAYFESKKIISENDSILYEISKTQSNEQTRDLYRDNDIFFKIVKSFSSFTAAVPVNAIEKFRNKVEAVRDRIMVYQNLAVKLSDAPIVQETQQKELVAESGNEQTELTQQQNLSTPKSSSEVEVSTISDSEYYATASTGTDEDEFALKQVESKDNHESSHPSPSFIINVPIEEIKINLKTFIPFSLEFDDQKEMLCVKINDNTFATIPYKNIMRLQADAWTHQNLDKLTQFVALRVLVFILSEIYEEPYRDLMDLKYADFYDTTLLDNFCDYEELHHMIFRYCQIKELINSNDDFLKAHHVPLDHSLFSINQKLKQIGNHFSNFVKYELNENTIVDVDRFDSISQSLRLVISKSQALNSTVCPQYDFRDQQNPKDASVSYFARDFFSTPLFK